MEKRTDLMQRVEDYVKMHKEILSISPLLCGSWDKGDIKGIWQETDGTVCISYENGQWFHYREEDGKVVWK